MAWISKKVKDKDSRITFDSETEFRLYKLIKKLKENGKIKNFEHEPTYELQEQYIDASGQKVKPIKHKPDFKLFLNDDRIIIIDSKSGSNSLTEGIAKIKKKIFSYQNREYPYHFVSELPKYLGNKRVETSSGRDFYQKIKNEYYKENPDQKLKKGKKNIQWNISNWDKYFEYEDAYGLGLFYTWKSTKKKKK